MSNVVKAARAASAAPARDIDSHTVNHTKAASDADAAQNMSATQTVEIVRIIADLYAHAAELEDGEVRIWLDRIQQRYGLTTYQLNHLCDEALEIGEWATRKVRELTRV